MEARRANVGEDLPFAGAKGTRNGRRRRYLLMGMTVGKTAIGGKELLAIMRRSDAP